MTDTAENRVFGKKREPHVLILARGDKVRHMTIRPWMAALAGCTIGLFRSVISAPPATLSCGTT